MREKPERKNARNRLAEVVPLKQPYVIMIDPCGVCNFKCRFCPVNNSNMNSSERHKVMDFETFRKINNDIKTFDESIKAVDLYAFGEPLLNKELPKMVKELKSNPKVDRVRTTTNGLLLSREKCQELVDAELDYIKISVEGLSEEVYRDTCGVEMSWDVFVDQIRYFYEISRNTKTEIGVKIISNTLKDGEREEFLQQFGSISDYTFVETVSNQWPEFENMEFPNQKEISDAFTQRFDNYEICSYPLTHMLVCSNGDIGICCFDWKHGTCYSNVHEVSLKDAWNSETLQAIRIKHLEGKRNEVRFCQNCTQCGYDNIDADAETILKSIM